MNKLSGLKHAKSELEVLTFDVELGSFYLQGHCHFVEDGLALSKGRGRTC